MIKGIDSIELTRHLAKSNYSQYDKWFIRDYEDTSWESMYHTFYYDCRLDQTDPSMPYMDLLGQHGADLLKLNCCLIDHDITDWLIYRQGSESYQPLVDHDLDNDYKQIMDAHLRLWGADRKLAALMSNGDSLYTVLCLFYLYSWKNRCAETECYNISKNLLLTMHKYGTIRLISTDKGLLDQLYHSSRHYQLNVKWEPTLPR